ncbi:hypothetical protein Tco_0289930, partial [Tanacetum coccineum]
SVWMHPRPNGDALRKCILKGPYTPTTVIIPALPATDNSLAVPKRTIVETFLNIQLMKCGKLSKGYNKVNPSTFNMSRQTYFGSLENPPLTMENQWSHITQGFTRLMNEMIRNNLIVAMMQVNVQFLQQLQPEWSRFVTIIKQQHKLDEVLYHKLFDILKQYQKEVNELRAERIAKNANPLALLATAQPYQDPYYQTSKSYKSYASTSKASLPTRSYATTRH